MTTIFFKTEQEFWDNIEDVASVFKQTLLKKGNGMNEMVTKNTDPRDLSEVNGTPSIKPLAVEDTDTEEDTDKDEGVGETDGEDNEEGCEYPSDEALKRFASK